MPDLAGCSHTSSRLPYPYPSRPQQNSYPFDTDSSYIQQQQGNSKLVADDYNNYDSVADGGDGRGDKPLSCFIAQTYKQSIPAGDVKQLPGLEWLTVDTVSLDTCGAACCKLGQTKCQYLWIVKGKCLAVSCGRGDEGQCLPTKFSAPSSNVVSTYFKMGYGSDEGI